MRIKQATAMVSDASAIPKSTVSDPETITPRIIKTGKSGAAKRVNAARAFLVLLRLLRRRSLLLLRAYGKSRCLVRQFGLRCFLVSGAWSEIRAHPKIASRERTQGRNFWAVCGRSVGSCCPSCVREKPLAIELLSCPCGQGPAKTLDQTMQVLLLVVTLQFWLGVRPRSMCCVRARKMLPRK